MVVASIVITTIALFIVVDLLLRLILTRVRSARTRKEREQALDLGLDGLGTLFKSFDLEAGFIIGLLGNGFCFKKLFCPKKKWRPPTIPV